MTMGKRTQRSNQKGEGEGITFLRSLLTHGGDACVTWPLFRDPHRGYGVVGYLGKVLKAHRLMCELTHGSPPSADHEAAHSCGRGHEGCVNPRHLSWKTRTENQGDRRQHGTVGNGGTGRRRKLTLAQVEEIRSTSESATSLSERFGVTRSAIRQIRLGKTWQHNHRSGERDAIFEIIKAAGRPMRAKELINHPDLQAIGTVPWLLKKLADDKVIQRVRRGVYSAL